MSYRARRIPARQTVGGAVNGSHHTGGGDTDRSSNATENEFSEHRFENNIQHASSSLPRFTKDKRRNNPTDHSRRSVQAAETRIPVAKRVPQRVPNNVRDGAPVTPVRERFRARHLDEESSTDRKDFQRNEMNVSKKVTFYRNGDKHFKGRTLFVTRQRYRSFESLLEDLSRVIPLPYGVRNVFSPVGQTINSINELEDGAYYICSSGDQLIRNIDYKNTDKAKSTNEVPCEGIQNITLSVPSDSSSNSSNSRSKKAAKPKIITIINQERSLKCKILLNRKTAKNYEDILRDVSDMMKLRGEHVHELYTQSGTKVGGLSDMFYGDDVYSATIVSTKRNLSNPSSHSSNGLDGLSPPNARKQVNKSRKKQRRDPNAQEQGVAIKVKGKKLVFFPPSKINELHNDDDELSSAPPSYPQLHWVYGYQGRDMHHNLHVLPSGEILYFVSRVVVIYNRQTSTQRHYTGHADDIKCMAVHPNQWYIATGQASGLSLDHNELSHIRVWDSETLLTLNVLQLNDYSLSVVAMAFSMEDNGDNLSCIDSTGDSFRLNIWEWKDSKCLVQSKGFATPASVVMFDPDDNKTIISCGKEHLYFWRWHNAKLERKNGLFENNPFPLYMTCLDFACNGDLFTGDSNGSITSWSKVSKKVKFVVRNAHEKTILCLRILDSGILLTAGGVDGRICAWDANKYFSTPLHEIQLSELTGICALEPLHSGESSDVTLIVGTTTNSIIEGSFTGPITTIVKGHKSEVPSFAVHPSRDLFVTASLDKTAILWSAVNKEMLWSVDVEFAIRVAAFYTTGSVIAFGTTQGRWIVLNAESGTHQASFQDGTEPITDLEYSPDGEHIAVGSKDGNIYIHAVYDDGMTYRRVGCCSCHTSPVMFLDWSVDGCFVQSISTEYEIITWEIGAFEREHSQNVIRDTEWNTRNVVLGYDVVGVWRSTPTEGNLVTSSDLAWSHNLIAVGDELGYIRVFVYPCYYDESQYHQVRAHSSTVLRVMFLSSDKFLLSTAGQDCAVLQWRMEGRMTPRKKRPKNVPSVHLQEILSNSEGQSDTDQGIQVKASSEHAVRVTKQSKRPKGSHSDDDDAMASRTSDEQSMEDQEKQDDTNAAPQRHRGQRDLSKNRRTFQQDMYQDRDDTSDERKRKILRNRRASKRHDHDDDESSDDDIYDDDDDDIDTRQSKKAKDSYARGYVRNGQRRSPDNDTTVEHSGNYKKSYSNKVSSDRYSKRDDYGDGRPRGYRRNKR